MPDISQKEDRYKSILRVSDTSVFIIFKEIALRLSAFRNGTQGML